MQLGMIGLGRMGANMVRRLMRAGHDCVVYDVHPQAVAALAGEGAVGSASLADFVASLRRPRAVWLMVPAAIVDRELSELTPLLNEGDIVIDGGNSYYHDDLRRAAAHCGRSIRLTVNLSRDQSGVRSRDAHQYRNHLDILLGEKTALFSDMKISIGPTGKSYSISELIRRNCAMN